ncbi:MAG: (Fe-S)-binding protein, partial [Nitrososphaerota archaeon]
DKSPLQLSKALIEDHQGYKNLIYSCFLCGLCASVCPLSLSPKEMFEEWRRKLVDEGVAPLKNHAFSMTDKKWNIYTLYRENYGIDYSDLMKSSCETAFFPGCNMATFAPQLTREVLRLVNSSFPSSGIVVECCQKPIHDIGLQKRFEDALGRLQLKLSGLGVKKLITACPNCFYTLRENLQGIEVITVYNLIEEKDIRIPSTQKITIHDSCPDRAEGLFASKVRGLLKNLQIVEMEHSRDRALCCGAGGLSSTVSQDLALANVKKRLEEARNVNADLILTYCVTCMNMLRVIPSKAKVLHVLNLILGVEEDYSQVQSNLQKLFTGPKAKENIMKITQQI